MRAIKHLTTALMAVGLLLLASQHAASQTINLWPGQAPGSEQWKQKEMTVTDTPVGTVVFNVVTPTLTPYLPDKSKASGAGIIIAPGGAFVALAIDLEGTSIARWLQERGIAAFVLKYRILEKKGQGIPKDLNPDKSAAYGTSDALQAIKLIRQHATEWGVATDKVGIVGFSAGGMIASETLLHSDAAARPNFVGLIYGAPFGAAPKIPAKLPPIFMAWAQDDDLTLKPVQSFYDALTAGGHKPEAHIYSAGGHGFGMKKQGTTSDHWIDEFYWWLQAQGVGNSVH
jgi:acetyl esterase/lipase